MNKLGIVLGLSIITMGFIVGFELPKTFPLNTVICFIGGLITGSSSVR